MGLALTWGREPEGPGSVISRGYRVCRKRNSLRTKIASQGGGRARSGAHLYPKEDRATDSALLLRLTPAPRGQRADFVFTKCCRCISWWGLGHGEHRDIKEVRVVMLRRFWWEFTGRMRRATGLKGELFSSR